VGAAQVTGGGPMKPMPSGDSPEDASVLHRQIFWLSLWYGCSAGTLFLNKIILTQLNGDIQILGCCQMAMTALLGALKVYGARYLCGGGEAPPEARSAASAESERVAYSAFRRNMLLVAVMRSSTILLGAPAPARTAAAAARTAALAPEVAACQGWSRSPTSRRRSPRPSRRRRPSSPSFLRGSSCARPRACRSTCRSSR